MNYQAQLVQDLSYQQYEMYLGGGFKLFYFHPYFGKISILTNIFQMGWNHQLGMNHHCPLAMGAIGGDKVFWPAQLHQKHHFNQYCQGVN